MEALHACCPGVAAAGGLRQCRRGPDRSGATATWRDARRARNGPAGRRPLRCLVPCRRRRAAMPETVAPGVYVEETGAGAHVIAGVPTSVAAFVGATASGPVAAPRIVHSLAEFEAQFGALAAELPLGYAVQQYFVNGGRDALIARIVPSGPTLTDADLSSPRSEEHTSELQSLRHLVCR